MDQLRQYTLTVVVGAILCGLLLSLVQGNRQEELFRLLCGVFLGILILRPLLGWDRELSLMLPEDILVEAAYQSSNGKAMAKDAEYQIISQQLEAYILDKAKELEADLAVTVKLGENLIPESAALQGRVSENTKEVLTHMIENDLGISKENQLWTG